MIATNQAFIRAYRHDSPRSVPTAPSAAGQPPAASDLGPSVQFVAGGAAYAAATFGLTATPDRPLAAADVSPYRDVTSTPTLPAAAAPVWRRTEPATIVKRPLSSFQAEPTLSGPPSRAGLYPRTTVPSFRWPAVCQAIGQQCAGPLDRVADVLEAQANDARSLVGVASLHAGEGATTTLLCLAARMATRGKRTILVDANFAAPCLAARLDVDPATYWQDVLEQGTPVDNAVIRSAGDQLDLLPLDANSPNAAQLATGLQVSVTAGVLRYAYDLVLVDLGAILAPQSKSAALELVRNMRIESALVVTRPDADPRDVAAVAHQLGQYRCELLGSIENRIRCCLD